jgi:hypothetical protein
LATLPFSNAIKVEMPRCRNAPRLTGVVDQALYGTFRAAGLEERDAQHLMLAVHDRCDRSSRLTAASSKAAGDRP